MKTINSIEKVNQLSENEFINTFGNVFEKQIGLLIRPLIQNPLKILKILYLQ
jgi:2-oxo-4-hydroxy-4-carboxy--5-ureidoimidazoline (OHCU) decarboxylase